MLIENQETAFVVNRGILEVSGILDELVALVRESDESDAIKKQFAIFIGSVLGSFADDMLNPLYRAHPHIKPNSYMLPEDF